MYLSVILSTYNSPNSLLKTLYSLEFQEYRDFEIVVADDGSGPETAATVRRARHETGLDIRHLWQEDRGFRKNRILNQAILASRGDYLIFLDGDIIARSDLIGTHLQHASAHQFLSCGSQVDIPTELHSLLTREAIADGVPFNRSWLAAHNPKLSGCFLSDKSFRLTCRPPVSRVLDVMLPRPGGFVGCNSSAWKGDLLEVNGFDEQITYGVDDRDLGVRLTNAGVRSRRLKYSLVYAHLAHPRPYAVKETIRANKRRIRQRRVERIVWTETGIEQTRAAA